MAKEFKVESFHQTFHFDAISGIFNGENRHFSIIRFILANSSIHSPFYHAATLLSHDMILPRDLYCARQRLRFFRSGLAASRCEVAPFMNDDVRDDRLAENSRQPAYMAMIIERDISF